MNTTHVMMSKFSIIICDNGKACQWHLQLSADSVGLQITERIPEMVTLGEMPHGVDRNSRFVLCHRDHVLMSPFTGI